MALRVGLVAGPGGSGGPGAGTTVGQLFLVDNSVLQRIRHPAVRGALDVLNGIGALATCLPLMLEAGFSARTAREHSDIMELLFAPFVKLAPAPQLIDIAIDMQSRLWAAGKVRSAGAFDTEVAAYAVHYTNANQHVVLVHYDSDYEHIASVRSDLVTRWIVPQGSVP